MRITMHSKLLVVALLAATSGAAQQPFDLDLSFRTTISERGIGEVYVLENGQIYITGYMIRYPGQLDSRSFLRINADGSRDDTFPDSNRGIGTITPWNGGYYVGGNPGVWRLFSDASRDTSFHHDYEGNQLYTTGQGADYHVNPDGSVIRTGTYTLNDPEHGFIGTHRLIFLTNTGHLDTTKTHRTGNANVWKIQTLSTGKLMCSIFGSQYDGQAVGPVFRIEPNGDLDPTFSALQIEWGYSYAFTELSDGKLLIGGNYRAVNHPDTICIARLMPDGQPDPSFHLASFKSYIPFGGVQTVQDILELPDHRLLTVGNFDTVDGYPRSGIVMLHADGTVDSTVFNDAGCGPFNYQPNGPNGETYPARQIVGITAGPDGNYYIFGSYVGYDDGTNNDPSQRFVSRMYGLSVGIAEHQQLHLTLYPNPATTAVTLQLENIPTNATVIMRDALGREVLQQRITRHYTILGTAGLGAGVYVVEVWESGQRVGVERVVVE